MTFLLVVAYLKKSVKEESFLNTCKKKILMNLKSWQKN